MDLITTIYNWGASTMRSLIGNDNPVVGLAGCTPSLPDRPEQESSAAPATSSPQPAPQPAQSADAGVRELDQEEVIAYLNANRNARQQVMEQICLAPEPHYYIGTQARALSETRGRQGQTITGLVIHGVADDLDLSDSSVVENLSVSFGEGIEVNNLRVENNQLVVDLVIAAEAAPGNRAVVITSNSREIGRLDQEHGFAVRRRGSGRRAPRPTPSPTPPSGNPFEL